MPFALAGAGVGAIGSFVGSGKQASATRDAASMQADAINKGTQLQRDEFNTVQGNEAPFLAAGKDAVSTLSAQLPSLTAGFDPTAAGLPANFSYTQKDFDNDPAFKFAMDEGTKAIQRTAAAKGGVLNPATQKSVAQYAEGTADQFYGEDYTRAENTYKSNFSNAFTDFKSNQNDAFNKLATLTGTGLNAATGVNAAGTNMANQSTELALQGGNSGAASIIGQANASAAGFGGASASIQSLLSTPSFQTLLKNYANGGAANNNASSYAKNADYDYSAES